VARIITLAFEHDPLWSRALHRADGSIVHHAHFWRLFVDGALRYPWSWIAGDGQATSVWIPPNGTELSERQEQRLEELIEVYIPDGADDFRELLARFEAAHPRTEPHYYLSLLGTHPSHRGHGLGMRLLAHDLELIDTEHMPAYLESSNPDNNRRYESVGFEQIGTFSFPRSGTSVTTMWRSSRQ